MDIQKSLYLRIVLGLGYFDWIIEMIVASYRTRVIVGSDVKI